MFFFFGTGSFGFLLDKFTLSNLRVSLQAIPFLSFHQTHDFFFFFALKSFRVNFTFDMGEFSREFPNVFSQKKVEIHFQTMSQFHTTHSFTKHTYQAGSKSQKAHRTVLLRPARPSSPSTRPHASSASCRLQLQTSCRLCQSRAACRTSGVWRLLEDVAGWRFQRRSLNCSHCWDGLGSQA